MGGGGLGAAVCCDCMGGLLLSYNPQQPPLCLLAIRWVAPSCLFYHLPGRLLSCLPPSLSAAPAAPAPPPFLRAHQCTLYAITGVLLSSVLVVVAFFYVIPVGAVQGLLQVRTP